MFAVAELDVSERLKGLRLEILEIKDLNRAYRASRHHSALENRRCEKQRHRLEEIKEELAALLQHSVSRERGAGLGEPSRR